jgi:hypothetical protein
MIELLHKRVIITIFYIVKKLKERQDFSMHVQEILKNTLIELFGMKMTTSKMENTLDMINTN